MKNFRNFTIVMKIFNYENLGPYGILINSVSYMIKTAENNVHKFTKEILLYLKISSTVIFDHRDNVSTTIACCVLCTGSVCMYRVDYVTSAVK